MVERREHLRFTVKPRQAFGILGDRREKDLDRDVAIQLRVARAIHFTHAARTEAAEDFVRAESCTSG